LFNGDYAVITELISRLKESKFLAQSNEAKSTNFDALLQNGGKTQTAQQLIEQSKTKDSRVKQLFGKAELTNALQLRLNFKAEGREEWLRKDDAQAIVGMDALIKNGTIDQNTIVIMHGGHGIDGLLRLTDYPHLKVQGAYHAVYEKFDDPMLDKISGSYRAENHFNSLQTYQDDVQKRTSQNKGKGTIYFGVDTHGKEPDPKLLPSPEQIRQIMGKNVKIVVLTEMKTGEKFDPTDWQVEMQPWFKQLKDAGIPVSGYGVNSRPSPREDGLFGGSDRLEMIRDR
jgi:hypothetical protein